MGIDVFLEWDGQEEERNAAGNDSKPGLFNVTDGHVGYLREAYHGGPYATRLLVPEAFESETCKAAIPAATLRHRLTHATRPAQGENNGHDMAAMIAQMLGGNAKVITPTKIGSGETAEMSVEEAVRIRQRTVYNSDAEHIEDVVQSFRDFVELAERKEAQLGKPCVVYASY
jgi:hypothetical protein